MSGSDTPFDPALVGAARSGDVAACGRLVTATEHLVRATVRAIVTDVALADDVVQDTYLRAFRRLGSIRDPAAFPAWIRRVAVSTARNELRRRRGTPIDPRHLDARPASGASAAPDDEGARLLRALRRAIVSLPIEQRRTCDRYYLGGWTTARLARAAGIGEAAVRKRLERLRTRLGKEMMMTLGTHSTGDGELSDRIVELLTSPLLIDLPENPVGAVWERIVALRAGDEVVELGEEVTVPDVVQMLGADAVERLPAALHRIDAERFLRYDMTVPMLLAARGRPRGIRLLAGGKVFRDDPVDRAHLQAFHQAELLWTGERLSTWSVMDVVTALLDDLLPGARVRIEEADFPLFTDQGGYEVSVQDTDAWVSVAGWARYADRVTAALGLDPRRDVALGLGLGLERIAALRYGIDDLRRMESTRVEPAADSIARPTSGTE